MSDLHVEPVAGWTTTAVVTIIHPYVYTRRGEGRYWVKLRKEDCRKLAYDLLRAAEDLAETEDG